MLAFLTLLWGSSFLLIKIASQAFDSAGFAFGRAGIAAAALAVVALAMRLRWPRSPRLWGQMAAMSLSGQVVPFLLFGVAAHLTTSADMALMMGGVPIFTFVIARLFALGEVWNARAAFGLALGLIGVAVSLASPLGSAAAATASEPGLGRALALLGALGYATGALLSRAGFARDRGRHGRDGLDGGLGRTFARPRSGARRPAVAGRARGDAARAARRAVARSGCSTPRSPISSISG